ncbi:hypothetical protein BH23PAT1_BH23PAT1_5050 [soil metagenome]
MERTDPNPSFTQKVRQRTGHAVTFLANKYHEVVQFVPAQETNPPNFEGPHADISTSEIFDWETTGIFPDNSDAQVQSE